MNSAIEKCRQENQADLRAASHTQPMVIVQESNWKAVIRLLERMSEMLKDMMTKQEELMTEEKLRDQLDYLMDLNSETENRLLARGAKINSELEKSLTDYTEQVGNLKEEYYTRMRQASEMVDRELKKIKRKIMIPVLVIQPLLTMLLVWLITSLG